MNKFITFEGVEGSGKSTQVKLLGEYLTRNNIPVLLMQEPSGTPIGRKIGEILFNRGHQAMCPETELFLFCAARAQHVAQVIRPALETGKIILSDRFIDSPLAYQGVGRGLGIGNIFDINCFATGGIMPDKTFFLDYPPDLAFSRMSKRREHDRLEKEEMAFHQTLYNGFIALSDLYPNRVIRVNAQGTKYETSDKIKAMMDQILKERKHA